MPKIGKDKWRHFWVAIPMAIVIYEGLRYFFWLDHTTLLILSSALIILICYGFELFSLFTKRGYAEWNDAIAGIIGGAAGLLLISLLHRLI